MSRIPIEMLDRYLSRSASLEEVVIVEQWLAESQAHTALTDIFRDEDTYPGPLISLEHVESFSADKESVNWERIKRRAVLPSPVFVDSRPIALSERSLPVVASKPRNIIAGVVVGIAALIGAFIAGIDLQANHRESIPASYRFTTGPGQRERITLPDGSTALLNAGSTIRYASGFGEAHRNVQLIGEAVFTIVHSEGAPFIVNTELSSTRVLGTLFSVRQYPTDRHATVTVAEGRVTSGGNTLAIGDAMQIDRNGHAVVSHGVNIASEFAWTDGRLMFYLTPLGDAVADLERWYGISIRTTDPILLKREISTTLYLENAAQAIELIGTAIHAKAAWDGQVVTLSPEAANK